MQIVHSAQPDFRIVDADDAQLADALQDLDECASNGNGRPLVHLAAACAAAQRALAAIVESEGALSWPQFAHATRIDEQVQACYARAGSVMLPAAAQSEPLPQELIHASAQLFRDIAAIYAREVAVSGPVLAAPDDSRDPALRSTRAVWCLGMSAKWTYFMHMGADGALWRACHAQYLRAESLAIAHRAVRAYHEPELGALSCADIYVQTLLLGMLNAGNLSAQQIELAHRWVTAFVRNAGIDASSDGAAHVFHVCLDSERGLEAGIPSGGGSAAIRFVDIEPVCIRLIDSRESLRRGRIDLGEAESHAAVLDYGAFLDLAERFWSPGIHQVQERAPRIGATPQLLDVVVGFNALTQALAGAPAANAAAQNPTRDAVKSDGNVAFLYPDAAEPAADTLSCMLKDYSDTGVGLLLPAVSTAPELGSLIGHRMSRGGRWEVGVLVRRLASPEADQTLLGIKGISASPVMVTLQHVKPGAAASKGTPVESCAIFAPGDGRRSRVDSLILRDVTYAHSKDFTLPAGNARFHIRLNRVLDRGEGWLRAGYQVLGKKPSPS
jgi:hypothetical protein